MSLPTALLRKNRLEIELGRRGAPGVSLGRYNYARAKPGLPDHAHPKAIEICFLVRGCQTYRVGDTSHRLTGGDVFITFPGEVHSTGGHPEEKGVLYWLILRDESHLPPKQATALRRSLLEIRKRQRHFRGSWRMQELLDTVTRLCHEPATGLNAVAIGNAVCAFLLEVVACSHKAPARRSPSLQPVLRAIEDRLEERVAVPSLAAIAGMSVARFKARFKEEIGMPPAEYMLRARIAEAQKRLAAGYHNVTRVGLDLGFSSSQYFATVYKRFTGHTPAEGRKVKG